MEVRHCAEHRKLLDRLMGRTILTDTDAVVCEYEGQRSLHQSRQTCHRLRVIAEYEEGCDIGLKTTVKHHSVSDRGHCKLTNTEVHVASCAVLLREISLAVHIGLVRRCQIRRSAHQVRHQIFQAIDDLSRKATGCLRLLSLCPEALILPECLLNGFLSVKILVPECFHLRILLAVSSKHGFPLCLSLSLFFTCSAEVLINFLRYLKRLLTRPLEELSQLCHILHTKRLTVSACLALLCRASVSDLGLDHDEGRSAQICLCLLDCISDCSQIISVLHSQSLEAKCLHTLLYILGKCNIRASLDRNLVGIIEYDQFSKSECSCE